MTTLLLIVVGTQQASVHGSPSGNTCFDVLDIAHLPKQDFAGVVTTVIAQVGGHSELAFTKGGHCRVRWWNIGSIHQLRTRTRKRLNDPRVIAMDSDHPFKKCRLQSLEVELRCSQLGLAVDESNNRWKVRHILHQERKA